MTFGGDFQFSNARMNYKNLDKLIESVNKISNITKVNAFYSTPSCYLYSLYKSNITWPVEEGDFVPYASRSHTFWTGFYTSRSALKSYVRRANNFLQAVRQLSFFANTNDGDSVSAFDYLNDAMGIVQHHDAISGTENQHTANDYSKRLSKGIIKVTDVISKSIGKLAQTTSLPNLFYCPLLNISECVPIENKQSFTVIIYNPLPRSVDSWIRIPIVKSNYMVYMGNQIIKSEIVEVSNETKLIPERSSTANYEIVFQATLPALGFNTYFINQTKKEIKRFNSKKPVQSKSNAEFSIQNQYLQLSFDQNGNVAKLENFESNIAMNLKHEFCYYKSKVGNNKDGENQSSGAYIFRPEDETPTCYQVSNYTVYRGNLYNEVHQVYNDWLSQTIRLYTNSTNIEFEWQVGPIFVDDGGKEVISKFSSDITSNGFFTTDSNGRQLIKRQRDYRKDLPDYYLLLGEKVTSNYYPINTRVFIADELNDKENRQLTIVTDRSQGASSVQDGNIEIMLHRRLLHDDSFGVDENLNEIGLDNKGLINKGKHFMIFNTTQWSTRLHRDLSHRINALPLITFDCDNSIDILKWNNMLQNELPQNIHMLTLQQEFNQNDGNYSAIMRIEHFYEVGDDDVLSQPVSIDLQTLFNNQKFTFISAEELSLGANMKVEELDNRLVFREDGSSSFNKNESLKPRNNFKHGSYVVEIEPFQIRTFRIMYNLV